MEKEKYAVAVTMVKSVSAGTNIQSILSIRDALSKEEAIGMAHVHAKELFPEHSIHLTCATSVSSEEQ